MGLVIGNPDTSYVVNFATDYNNCYLSIISLADGSISYQNQFPTGYPSDGYLAEIVDSGTQYEAALVDTSLT